MIFRLAAIIFIHVLLCSCNRHYVNHKQDFNHYSLKETEQKKVFTDSIFRFKSKVEAETGRVLATSTGELTKDGDVCTLGNFTCDALKFVAESKFADLKVDAVIVNRGGLRANLPMGEIKVLNIFELMPFENEMVVLNIAGKYLKQVLNLIIEKRHPFLGMQISNVKDKQNPVFTIGGKEIKHEKIYTVITSDYLFTGGDNFVFFKNAESAKITNIKIRDAIITYCDYITSINKKITPYKDERLELAK